MQRHSRTLSSFALGAAVLGLVAGCGSDDDGGGNSSGGGSVATVEVHLTDTGCSPTTLTATRSGGNVSFKVVNDTDADKEEFEILSPAPEILLEKFLDKKATATYEVALAAGTYQIICGLPSDTRADLTVAPEPGETIAPTTTVVDQAALTAATTAYQQFVLEQVELLQTSVKQFTDAVRSGDTEAAQALYAPVRVPWETIEPVAELFPDSDAVIDSRSDDFPKAEADTDFTGFHALEYGLWANGTIDGATVDLPALATRLDADIDTLITSVKALTIQPQVMTNGAAALIEEAAQTKITGEEDRYSHTDLYTFNANVVGAQKVFTLVEPLLKTADPALDAETTAAFAAVNAALDPYRTADGFETYDKVTQADQNTFKTTMAALSESLSKVTGALGLVVTG